MLRHNSLKKMKKTEEEKKNNNQQTSNINLQTLKQYQNEKNEIIISSYSFNDRRN